MMKIAVYRIKDSGEIFRCIEMPEEWSNQRISEVAEDLKNQWSDMLSVSIESVESGSICEFLINTFRHEKEAKKYRMRRQARAIFGRQMRKIAKGEFR